MATIVLARKPASAAGPFPVTLYTRSTALIDNNKDPLLADALWIESLTTKGTKTHIYHPPSKGASFPRRHVYLAMFLPWTIPAFGTGRGQKTTLTAP